SLWVRRPNARTRVDGILLQLQRQWSRQAHQRDFFATVAPRPTTPWGVASSRRRSRLMAGGWIVTRPSGFVTLAAAGPTEKRGPMTGLLHNRLAAITGAGSGIGRGIALGYAREGARVVVLDINGEAAAKTAAEIRDAGGKAEHLTLDVTDQAACRAIAGEVEAKIGTISILVNDAGINRRNAFTADA